MGIFGYHRGMDLVGFDSLHLLYAKFIWDQWGSLAVVPIHALFGALSDRNSWGSDYDLGHALRTCCLWTDRSLSPRPGGHDDHLSLGIFLHVQSYVKAAQKVSKIGKLDSLYDSYLDSRVSGSKQCWSCRPIRPSSPSRSKQAR